jgi:hypothetical protein
MVIDEGRHFLNQILFGRELPSAQKFAGQNRKECFNLIEPAGMSRGVMYYKARVFGYPGLGGV